MMLDQLYGDFVQQDFSLSSCDRMVHQPVFILPILTWHIGHLIVDIIESLYYTMKGLYGGKHPPPP